MNTVKDASDKYPALRQPEAIPLSSLQQIRLPPLLVAALLLSTLMVSAFSNCAGDVLFDKSRDAVVDKTAEPPPEPYSLDISMTAPDWVNTEHALSGPAGCSPYTMLTSYSRAFTDGGVDTSNDGRLYFGLQGSPVAGTTWQIYISSDLTGDNAATGRSVYAEALSFAPNTAFDTLIEYTDGSAPVMYTYNGSSWSVQGALQADEYTLSAGLVTIGLNLSRFHADWQNAEGVGLSMVVVDNSPSVSCAHHEDALTAGSTATLFSYIHMDFTWPYPPNSTARLRWGIEGYTHTLAADNSNDFWPLERLDDKTATACDVYATYDADYLYLGFDSPVWQNSSAAFIMAVAEAGAESSSAFTGLAGYSLGSKTKLKAVYTLEDPAGSPVLTTYTFDGSSFIADSTPAVTVDSYSNADFIKLRISRPADSRFNLTAALADSSNIICSLSEADEAAATADRSLGGLPVDNNLTDPPGL